MTRPKSHRAVRAAAPVVAFVAGLLILMTGLSDRDPISLREQLKSLQFWFLEIGFLIASALAIIQLPHIYRRLDLDRRSLFALGAICLLALILVTEVAPRTHRIFYDEQIYLNIGQNLSDLRLAQLCNEGSVEYGRLVCNRGEYNKQPYGYPYLLSLGFRLFGVSDTVAFFLNNLYLILLVVVVFVISMLLFADRTAALTAALVISLIPHQLLWSNTAAVEPSAAMAAAVAVVSALWFVREPSTTSLLWVVAATSFACQFRTESILCVPLVLAIIVGLSPQELLRPRFWWAALLGLVLLAALAGHLVAVRHEGWGSPGPRLSWGYLLDNLRVNGLFYLSNVRFPVLYTLLALWGIVRGWRREVFVPLLYFLLFWGIFLFFYAGSYNYGADVRYSLMTYPPLAVLAGRGLSALLALFPNSLPRARLLVAASFLVGFNFLEFMPLVRAVGEEAWAARADVRFAREFREALPPSSIILTHNPNMFLVWGANAAQISFAVGEPDYLPLHLSKRYADGVYFHWNFWCNVDDAASASLCQQLLERFHPQLVEERWERGYRYALYRIQVSPDSRSRPQQRPRKLDR